MDRFHFHPEVNMEQLEPGIYLEVFSREDAAEAELGMMDAVVFGELEPDPVRWQVFQQEAYLTGAIRENGDIVWNELEQFCRGQSADCECMYDVSLDTLCTMVEDSELVLCRVNDFVLEDIRAAALPGLSGNSLVWVSGLDLTDLNDAAVSVGWLNGTVKQVPLGRFLRSWKTGGYRAITM